MTHNWTTLLIAGLLACGNGGSAPDSGPRDASTDVAIDAPLGEDAAVDSAVDGGADSSVDAGEDAGVETCGPSGDDASGTDVIEDENGRATVVVTDRDRCHRSYTLTSTASLRDGEPDNPRVIVEDPASPTTRTGNDMFDALHALALEEVRECAVDQIRDGAFNDGAPLDCGEGGCFETGRLWHYVWTRDTAYSVDLGLAPLDPLRSRNSLERKISERRTGGDLQIVQDTGSGGSYPVSTDRVSWALGAEALLHQLQGAQRESFAARAFDAIRNTLEHDRGIAFDETDGLYRGEQSFLDWREQSYPEWTQSDTVHLGMSKALSTNLLHNNAMRVASRLAEERGETALRDRYRAWADAHEMAIQRSFWLEDEGLFSTFLTTTLDASATRRFDLLGSALAVILGVATDAQAARIVASYPHYGPATSVHWPQQQFTPIYHNRGEWPFVDAYWLRAAAQAGNDAVADRMVRALMRGAAINLSNMENFEAASGAPFVDEGESSGPIVNSQRQLWSVAGYLSMVHRTLFGLEATADGLAVRPFLSAALRGDLFADTDTLVLNDFPYHDARLTVVLHLPASGGAGAYSIRERRLDGDVVGDVLPRDLSGPHRVDVFLGDAADPASITTRDPGDWRAIFQPRTPRATVARRGSDLVVGIDRNGESDEVTFAVYRNGVRVADDLPSSASEWVDASPDLDRSPCYSIEACFAVSGNCSQHAPPTCWWGASTERVRSFPATDLRNVGGSESTNHGRFHYENWGDAGHSLELASFEANDTGAHLLQVVYGNGAGGVTTGITCAVKRAVVYAEDGTLVGEGALIMPHLGTWSRWADSNFVSVDLVAGERYRIVIESDDAYVNMSAFDHFEAYTGGLGGRSGEFNRVNISELKVLVRP